MEHWGQRRTLGHLPMFSVSTSSLTAPQGPSPSLHPCGTSASCLDKLLLSARSSPLGLPYSGKRDGFRDLPSENINQSGRGIPQPIENASETISVPTVLLARSQGVHDCAVISVSGITCPARCFSCRKLVSGSIPARRKAKHEPESSREATLTCSRTPEFW